MKTFELPVKVKVKVEGEVLNPGDEGWRGMSKEDQKKLKGDNHGDNKS